MRTYFGDLWHMGEHGRGRVPPPGTGDTKSIDGSTATVRLLSLYVIVFFHKELKNKSNLTPLLIFSKKIVTRNGVISFSLPLIISVVELSLISVVIELSLISVMIALISVVIVAIMNVEVIFVGLTELKQGSLVVLVVSTHKTKNSQN